MPDISFLKQNHRSCTPIPDDFILRHMPAANGAYVKVYLYIYYHFLNASQDFTTKSASQALNLIESDVLEALYYWASEGVLKLDAEDDQLTVSFPSLTSPEPNPPAPKKEEPETPPVSKVVRVEHKPSYTPEELAIYQNNPQIQRLFSMASEALGEILSFPNLSLLYSFYDYYRLPTDVIEYLVAYCVSNGNRSLRYMEKVAQDWADRGITSLEKAQEHTKRFQVYRPIMKALGITGRNPSETDIRTMDRWVEQYRLPMELILEACRRTVAKTGQASFHYAEGILADWHSKQIHTLEDGDKITYTTKLGTRTYEVFYVGQIEETDFSRLGRSSENMITLITCVRNVPEMRWCVQAREIT